MARYLFSRLAGIVIVFWIVSVVIFLLMHAIPGGPYNEDKVPLTAEAKANCSQDKQYEELLQVWA